MATFASTEQAKIASGDVEQEEEVAQKNDSRRLNTTEVSSMFNLRSELLKKKTDASKTQLRSEYSFKGKSDVLSVKKEEREQKKREDFARKDKLTALEKEMRREELEAIEKSRKSLLEKAQLYEKLNSGTVFTHTDNTPVEFMVDFAQKPRDAPIPDEGKTAPEHFVPYEEQRVYGTSHVILSQDEETRQQEINKIKNISKETEQTRIKQKIIMDEKERLRLEKTNRMRRKAGLPEIRPPTPPLEEPGPSVDQIPLPENRPSDKQEVSFEAETLKRIRADREWDRGKNQFTNWIEKQREEREDDFRPPDFYYK